MRNILLSIAICFMYSCNTNAQVVEKPMNMSSGEQAGLEVDLASDPKASEKLWKEYVKPFGKTDWDRKNKEHVLFNVHIPDISAEPVTVVAKFNQGAGLTKGSFWLKQGEGFINSEDNAEELRKTGEFLQEFAYEAERYSIREELKKQEKDLERLQKDLERLVKKNKNLHKDIDKAKSEIAKKEGEIETNLEEQVNKKDSIEEQKTKIQETATKLTQVGKN